jgi:hypothetical protein
LRPPIALLWRSWKVAPLFSLRKNSLVHPREWSLLTELKKNVDIFRFSILLPGSLGGLPQQSWGRIFMKGEVDDLSWDVSAFKRLAVDNKVLANDLKLLLDKKYTPERPDLTQLILDPKSIPIIRPKDQSRLVREAVEQALPGLTKNREIRQIISGTTAASGDKLLIALSQTSPLYPQIMSDIYSYSPAGVRDTMISRFTMTRTITALTGNPNFINDITAGNITLLRNILRRYDLAQRIPTHHRIVKSAFEICGRLRSFWGPTVKHENIGVYCPLDYDLTSMLSTYPTISASSRSPLKTMTSTIGMYPPNFGTQTKEKVSMHGFKVTSTSSTFAEIKALVLTASELDADGPLAKIIDDIIGSRCPWSLGALTSILPTSYGGTAAHRHNEITTRLFSVLGSRTVPTHITFCTDNAGTLSGGEHDYPLVFQEYFLTLTSIYQALALSESDMIRDIGIRVPDELVPLPDDRVTAPDTSIQWARYADNKLCYTDVIQFREVPTTPSPTIAHQIPLHQISNRSLIFNCWLGRSDLRSLRQMKPSSIVLPTELLDLKEFNHCPYRDIITGTAWYIAVMSIYDCARAGAKDAHLYLGDAIRSNSYRLSSMLARQCVHKLNYDTRTNSASNIRLMPGALGAQNAASSMSGDLIQRAFAVIESRELLTAHDFQFVLFQDSSRKFNSLLLIVCIAMIGFASPDSKRFLIKPYDKMILDLAYTQAESMAPNMLGLTLLNNALQDILQSKRDSERILWSTRNITYYCNTTGKEAIRDFRNRALDVRLKTDPQCGFPPARITTGDGKVRWTTEHMYGSYRPDHICDVTAPKHRQLDLFLSGLMRPFGRYASAMSAWSVFLRYFSKRIANRRVLTVGVGHGATSALAIRANAAEVYGIDLRTSFPVITQREATYIPPEVLETGVSQKFKWDNYVYEFGGDITAYPEFAFESEPEVVILDVELDLDEQLSFLNAIPHGVLTIMRVICCTEKLKWLISATNPLRVVNTSVVRWTPKQSWIIAFESLSHSLIGNSRSIHIESITPFRPDLNRDLKYSTTRINDLIRPSGYEVMEASLAHLDDVHKKLVRDSVNSNDQWFIDRLKATADYVDLIRKWTRIDPEKVTLAQVQSLSLHESRQVTRHLSCVWNDRARVVDRLIDEVRLH